MPLSRKRPPSSLPNQRGAALLLLMMLFSVGTLAVFVTGLNRATVQQERERVTFEALARAKEALIGRAAADNNRPGSLPCPDVTNDGIADGCLSYSGRLPWKTLDLPDLRDGWGERLWYELSPNFRDSTASEPLNNVSTAGMLDGGGVAAKIYAPGPALDGQHRDAANVNVQANYLEGLNDTTLGVPDRAIFGAAIKRVAGEIRFRLNAQPYPVTMPVPAAPLRYAENWAPVVTYTKIFDDEAQVSFAGCAMVFTMKWDLSLGQSKLSWVGAC